MASDHVKRPRHYVATLRSGEEVECRELALSLGFDFALANVLKYIWRAGKKSEAVREDLEKAAEYLRWKLETLE